jgi:hypothetical protein
VTTREERQTSIPAVGVTSPRDDVPFLLRFLARRIGCDYFCAKCGGQSRCLTTDVPITEDTDGLAPKLADEEPRANVIIRSPAFLNLANGVLST